LKSKTINMELFTQPHYDISHGRYNEVSKEMNQVVAPHKENDRNAILSLIDGMNSTMDIATILDKPINKISGRFTELKAKGLIESVGTKQVGRSKFTIYKKIKQHDTTTNKG